MTKKDVEKFLQPFYGYVELGMFIDAAEQWEKLSTQLKTHPVALLARMDLLIEMKWWEEGVKFGEEICLCYPSESDFWIKRAYCLHELKRTIEAKTVLLSGPESLKEQAVYFYNLACYETQLGNIESSKGFLSTCFHKNKSFRQEALLDPDLEPLWKSIDATG